MPPFLALSHTCIPHVWHISSTIKGQQRRPLDRRWRPQTNFQIILSPSCRHNRSSIDTVQNIPFSLRSLLEAGHRRKSECPSCFFLDTAHTVSVCAPASSRRPTSFSILFLCYFPLFLSATLPLFWVSGHYQAIIQKASGGPRRKVIFDWKITTEAKVNKKMSENCYWGWERQNGAWEWQKYWWWRWNCSMGTFSFWDEVLKLLKDDWSYPHI